jgi:hypothetical protein
MINNNFIYLFIISKTKRTNLSTSLGNGIIYYNFTTNKVQIHQTIKYLINHI